MELRPRVDARGMERLYVGSELLDISGASLARSGAAGLGGGVGVFFRGMERLM